jgi:hypothetical protein
MAMSKSITNKIRANPCNLWQKQVIAILFYAKRSAALTTLNTESMWLKKQLQ